MARVALAAGLVLIAAGGAAIAFGVTREAEGGMPPEAKQQMTEAMTAFDATVRKLDADTEARAKALAADARVRELDMLDGPTLANMMATHEDFFSDLKPGEEVGFARAQGSAVETLLVLPTGTAAPDFHAGELGSHPQLLAGRKLAITAIAQVEFLEQRPELRGHTGLVAVTRPMSLAPALDALAAAHVDGTLVVAGDTVAIGAGVVADAPSASQALAALPAIALRYIDPPATMPAIVKPAIAGGGGATLLGLVLFVVGVRKPRAPAAATATGSAVETTGFVPKDSATKYSEAHDVPTTTPGRPAALAANGSGPREPTAGQMIGRWEVVRRLGSGGMADVYLARARGEAGFEKLVALKVMHAHLARNERAVEHFLDEARLAANVQHANVVAIQDLGRIGDDYAIVMEYVDGVDLERLLLSARTGSRPVPVAIGLGILCRICDGLEAAHKATAPDGTKLGIIHRDVKSANVLVSKQGGVKVVDFGIAKAATQSHLTIAGETKGTPSMMAPEQRVGEQVDVRADVYAVAAVGFEILTNHGVNLDLAALAHLGVDNWPHLPLPSSLRPELPSEIDALLLGAMAFERDKRPASCEALEASFATVMKAHGLAATDKDIARWVESELVYVAPAPPPRPLAIDMANKSTG